MNVHRQKFFAILTFATIMLLFKPCYSKKSSCPNLKSNEQYIVLPQNNPPSGSIFSNDPGVTIFTNTFTQRVYSSDILSDVFDLSKTSPKEYSEFVYKYNLEKYKHLGFKDAASIAEFAARGITKLDVITMPLMVRNLHNTAGNFLFVERILTCENAKSLACAYAETIEKYAHKHLTSDPKSKFGILANSFFEFVLSIDIKLDSIYPMTTYYFGNEWFVADLNYKWINNC